MKFTLNHKRDIIGNEIFVKVVREKEQLISAIETELDGFVLGIDRLGDPSVQVERSFRQAGVAGPGDEHTLVVRATDTEGNKEAATRIWVDQM